MTNTHSLLPGLCVRVLLPDLHLHLPEDPLVGGHPRAHGPNAASRPVAQGQRAQGAYGVYVCVRVCVCVCVCVSLIRLCLVDMVALCPHCWLEEDLLQSALLLVFYSVFVRHMYGCSPFFLCV